jgi:hypothetical protein
MMSDGVVEVIDLSGLVDDSLSTLSSQAFAAVSKLLA